jgi:homoserine dehydrogenase
MTTATRPLNVAIAGFGTVGRSVARILCEGRHHGLRLAAICTRRPDAVRRDAPWIPPAVVVTSDIDALIESDADVCVELVGGVEPARTWIAAVLQSGRAVVTANKQVIAEHGPELFSLARSTGNPLRFEAAVAGAVPVIRGLQDGLAGDRVTRIAGVVNGTCNFVLGRMADAGVSLDEAVREAQARGFAEADPAADLDGLDARAKLSILAAIGLGDHLPPRRIPAGTIRGIDAGDIAAAASLGRVIRQVVWADRSTREPGAIAAGVGAALVRRDSWLGRARGPENVVLVQGERSGTTVFAGQGAGGDATAVAVVSDLLTLAERRSVPRMWPASSAARAAPDDVERPHYVRASTTGAAARHDAPHLLAQAGLEVDSVLALPCGGPARWAAVVHPCRRTDLDRALAPLLPADGAAGTLISLPLFDTET